MRKQRNIVLEKPQLRKALDVIKLGLSRKRTIVLAGNCWVDYEGRASSKLEPGERIVIFKPDGSALVHRPRDYPPVNWQPPGSLFYSKIKEGTIYIRIYRRKEHEVMKIYFDELSLVSVLDLRDSGDFYLYASEKDMHDAIIFEPNLLEEGFRPINHEHSVSPGFIDILGVDKDGNLVVAEIKRSKATKNAVFQLKKYMDVIDQDENRKVRGVLVAPDLAQGVQELLKIYGFEYKFLTPQKCSEILKHKNSTLLTDFFKEK